MVIKVLKLGCSFQACCRLLSLYDYSPVIGAIYAKGSTSYATLQRYIIFETQL